MDFLFYYLFLSALVFLGLAIYVMSSEGYFWVVLIWSLLWFVVIPLQAYYKFVSKYAYKKMEDVTGKDFISMGFKNYLRASKYRILFYSRITFMSRSKLASKWEGYVESSKSNLKTMPLRDKL